MKLRLLLAALLTASGLVVVVACDNNDQSEFDKEKKPEVDAGGVAPCFGCEAGADASDSSARVCTPQFPASFKPTFAPPTASQKVCDATQIDNYYKACLAGAWNSVACQAFVKSEATCAKCLDTQDTDPKSGPIVWRLDHGYFNVNIPGCVALTQNDSGPNSCAAAYEGWLSCARVACTACFQKGDPEAQFQKLGACQTDASKQGFCQSLNDDRGNKCGELAAPDAATSVCLPASGETLRDVYNRTAALFCNK